MVTTYFFTGLLFFLSVSSFIWVSGSLRHGEESIADISSQIASLEEERLRARKIEGILAGKEAEVNRIENFFVRRDRPADFVEELEGLASSTGTKILISSLGDGSVGDSLNLELTVEGNKDSVLIFLKLLELLPHDILVDDVIWKSGPGLSSLELNIKTKVF